MSWRGFIIESKSYMSYPTQEEEYAEYYHSDIVGGKSCRERKTEFWLRFPRAWLLFQWFGLTSRAVDLAARLGFERKF